MRDALMEGIAGLGQSGYEYAKTSSALKESAARLKESDQNQKLNSQRIDANAETAAQALGRKQLLGSIDTMQGERMALPVGVRNENPTEKELLAWSRYTEKPIDEVRSSITRTRDEASQVGLENESKRQSIGYNSNLIPLNIEGKRLDNRQTAAQTSLIGAQTTKAGKEMEGQGKDLKLTEKQSSTLGAAGMAKTMLDDIANQFKGSNLGGAKGFASDVVESIPLVGGKLAPATNAYNDKRRITAETFLREATGAAAPAAEIKFYTNLLPEPGDSEEQAQSSLNAFRGAVLAKVQGVAATLRAQGKETQAQEIESRMGTLFDSSVNIKAPAAKLDDLTDDDLDSQLRAKGIDPMTGKPIRGGANGAF